MSAEAVNVSIEPKPNLVAPEMESEKELPAYPGEVAEVASLKAGLVEAGLSALEWGLESGILKIGEVSCAEVSPTFLCTESCPGCPDSNLLRQQKAAEAIANGKTPKKEERARLKDFVEQAKKLKELGVKHVMNIGGTIDKFRGLKDIIESQLAEGLVVSWFTDGIPQLDENTGLPNDLFQRNLDDGWLKDVATHVSTDYVYANIKDKLPYLFGEELELPSKTGRVDIFKEDGEYSRKFKSQYSAVMARRLIEAGVRRTVVNMTISTANADQIDAVYQQAVDLQDYAKWYGSPTEVLFTFSPWTWRPHQARGDDPIDHSPNDALRAEDMPKVNEALTRILDDTYKRVEEGRPRLLANSSGYTYLHSDPAFRHEAVQQDVGYRRGLPLMLDVEPNAEIRLDPMFMGPELNVVRSTFGYMDREADPSKNPFSDFQHGNRTYLPNLISSVTVNDPEVQPMRMMDRRLARWICQLGVIGFIPDGESSRNVTDSLHAVGNPRLLSTEPAMSNYTAERLLHIIEPFREANDVLVGIASYGLGLGNVASALSYRTDNPVRFNYVKPNPEPQKSDGSISGKVDPDSLPIIVDDLLFHGSTTRKARDILATGGGKPELEFTRTPKHAVYIIDRQLEHREKGPSLEDDGITIHSMITMGEIVSYMIENDCITPGQLHWIRRDYRGFPRYRIPDFALLEEPEA